MPKQLNVSILDGTFSVYYDTEFLENGRTKCPICGKTYKGRDKVFMIEEIVNANTYENVQLNSALAKKIERQLNAELGKMNCSECTAEQLGYQRELMRC